MEIHRLLKANGVFIGAFVWFVRIIEWEFPEFSVDGCFDKLLEMQSIIEKEGAIKGNTHRYLLVAKIMESED